ncbi:NAD(P)/FAD-dependent oxidoreductase [Janthinobacterium fluminis]|uniref:FAD/NAD(P)-binding oxidoreductase n=1 Tax=Janthinobacterium fluminis TaxID=2987524 RepID=A0ABT5JXC1_9BURK|nr:FAD/NAD(P)-binding oxidoreductase [Janthinobacterium fluminis]MDC8757131.1 FAD/NAD(P)-binding oxidoreductase [Janthinobacterium fluminis]
MTQHFDVLIIGAGPAGLAAAAGAATAGGRIGIVDDNPLAGGQIWRGGPEHGKDARGAALWGALRNAGNVEFLARTRVLYPSGAQELRAETPAAALTLRYGRLIIATGARERLLPFPGWTLPGVTGAGGLQALAKGGYPVAGKRIVVAGSGPLLLAVGATLRERGAHILAIVEQTPLRRLARFALALPAAPGKLTQALQLRRQLSGVPYHGGAYIRAAGGDGQLRDVTLQQGAARRTIECEHLACGYGLIPNLELAGALGCAMEDGAVAVDGWQQSSVPGTYCAGESTGVGGVDLALAEGRIAGLATVNATRQAARHLAERARWQRFAARLSRAFALRPELRGLCDDDTIVCRCEDVRHGELARHANWRSAKLHTRCGMGACQGRICGGAAATLYGWRQDDIRLPLSPARIASLLADPE